MQDELQSSNPKPCPECGGERIRARTVPPVGLTPEPLALFSRPISEMVAIACINCGYTSFYAINPEKIVRKTLRQ